jgi:hypothetical protein
MQSRRIAVRLSQVGPAMPFGVLLLLLRLETEQVNNVKKMSQGRTLLGKLRSKRSQQNNLTL